MITLKANKLSIFKTNMFGNVLKLLQNNVHF